MIYLDCAASALQRPACVAARMMDALTNCGNAGRGAHGPAMEASRTVYQAREALAVLLQVSADRIAFTSGTTESLNLITEMLVRPGIRIVTDATAHNAVLRPLYRKQAAGAKLTVLPADEWGHVPLQLWEQAIGRGADVLYLTHASNVTGIVCPVREIADMAHRAGALVVVDAAQTMGEYPVLPEALGCDVLCFSGHKGLMGPQGTGGLYIREDVPVTAVKTGGSGFDSFSHDHPGRMPEVMEAGTANVHGLAGLAAAAAWVAQTGPETIGRHGNLLARRLIAGVRDIPGIRLYGDMDAADRVPVVTLNLAGLTAAETADLLWTEHKICVRAGAHCAPLIHEALGCGHDGAVRFSFGWYNTEAEADIAADALRTIARECGAHA